MTYKSVPLIQEVKLGVIKKIVADKLSKFTYFRSYISENVQISTLRSHVLAILDIIV